MANYRSTLPFVWMMLRFGGKNRVRSVGKTLPSGDRGQGFDPHPYNAEGSLGASSIPSDRGKTVYIVHLPYLVKDGVG
ncbi:hypothetical protein Tco_0063714, partial [Tanacetum coccineum]